MSHQNSALTLESQNTKTGRMVISSTARPSCPSTCPLAGDGCYGDNFRTKQWWDKITDGRAGVPPDQFIRQVAALPDHERFRHNITGDLWHLLGVIDRALVLKLAKAAKHLKAAWCFTHHLPTPANLETIRASNSEGFTINLSTESRYTAAELHKQGLPVVCVVPEDAPQAFTYEGVKFRQCPATLEDSVIQCRNCGNGTPLCARADRSFVVTFPAHGTRKRKAAAHCS